MINKLLNSRKKATAIVLILTFIISAVILTNNLTLAAPADIPVTLVSPNTYTAIEIGAGNALTVTVTGLKVCAGGNNSVATVERVVGGMKITGVKAGVVPVGVNSAVYTVVVNYQITDSTNISAYTIKGGREVCLSGPGKTKPVPIVVNVPNTGNPASKITWKSLQTNIATVSNGGSTHGTITAHAKGAAIIIGEFTDKWGVSQYIPILVGVGVNVNEVIIGDLSELIELIIKGETILKLEDNPYTPESLGKLQEAVDDGKAVIDTDNPTNTQITNAIKGLQDAIAKLKKIGGGTPPVKGKDGNYYKPVGRPPNVWVKVDEDGEPLKYPPEYVYNPGDVPGDGNDRDAFPDGDGNFWVEAPKGSNIWKKVKPDAPNAGSLIDSPAIWGGPDGKFGGGDDLPVTKFGNDYWVSRGQNVWQKVLYPPTSLGELTGGGPNENPSTGGVTPIKEVNGIYYIGPVGTDSDGNQYYYGDSKELGRGNGKVMSSKTQKHYTDDIYYFSNGEMVTENPKAVISVVINPKTVNVVKGGTQTFTAKVLLRDGTEDAGGVQWTVSPAGAGTSINLNTGVLTVGAGETNTTLTVTARSNKTQTITSTATVTVTTNPNGIKSVTVTPSNITVERGKTQQFSAEVRKNDNTIEYGGVTWSVSPTTGGTSIDQNGVLTIGSSVAANTQLTITATSKTDPSVKSTANVTVKVTNLSDYFKFVGDAKVEAGSQNTIVITPNQTSRKGAMWASEKINLSNPFYVEMSLVLGSGDGVAFVLQNDNRGTTAIGDNGAGLGAYGPGYINRAIALEFDTYYNGDNNQVSTDPSMPGFNSHISFVTPYSRILPSDHLNNAGFNTSTAWKTLSISWTPQGNGGTLIYSFDSGKYVQTYTIGNVSAVFGSPTVYWGITGATGVSSAYQAVRFDKLP
jgi:hypothetical protein